MKTLMVKTGDLLESCNGRKLSPVPKIDVSTERRTTLSLQRLDAWLLREALQEAHNNDYLTLLLPIEGSRLSEADRQLCNDVLFGDRCTSMGGQGRR